VIAVEQSAGVAVVRLSHGKANALDLELCAAIVATLERLEHSDDRAIVLTGQGRMFSAGVDLVRLAQGGADYVRDFLKALHRLYDTAFFHPKPVIAAINGHAIAGGCVLACCADRRIAAADGGRIGVTELLVGVPFPALTFEVMRFATAPQFLADGMLTGATFPPEEALRRGLVDELSPADTLIDRAVAVARTLGALPPATFALTKRQIRQPVADRMAAHGAATDSEAERIWTAPDTIERVRAYVEATLKKS
jgi:enoyl-CoA hydratase